MSNGFIKIDSFPDYMINESGSVYSMLSNKILTPRVRNKSGYLFVTLLTTDKVSKNILVNRLVAHVYLGMIDLYNDLEVDHKDRNIHNNHYKNLQVLTKQEHLEKTLVDKGFIQRNKTYCKICSVEIKYKAEYCQFHRNQNNSKGINLTKEMIESDVKSYGWVHAAEMHDMTDNGLRKNYKRLGGEPNSLKKEKR